MSERLGRDYFERLYADSRDPWNFETSEYERKRYDRTLSVLGDRSFRRGLEAGASIGVFTRMLAERCDELLAVDVSEKAVAEARERLKDFRNVRAERLSLPEQMPAGPFDLIAARRMLEGEIAFAAAAKVTPANLQSLTEAIEQMLGRAYDITTPTSKELPRIADFLAERGVRAPEDGEER